MSLRIFKYFYVVLILQQKVFAKESFPEIAVNFVQFGNYYEAITEFRRFLFFTEPLSAKQKNVIVQEIGDLYFLSQNYEKSQKYYQNLNDSLSRDLRLLDVTFYQNKPFYEDLVTVIKKHNLTLKERKILQKEAVRAFVARGQYSKAWELLSGADFAEAQSMRAWLKEGFPKLSYANLFWGIFPGGAHFAMGNFRLGVYSFFTVSGITALGVWALSKGAFVGAILAFSFSLRFYLSSFSEALRLMVQENEFREKKFQEEFLQKTGGEIRFCQLTCSRLELSLQGRW